MSRRLQVVGTGVFFAMSVNFAFPSSYESASPTSGGVHGAQSSGPASTEAQTVYKTQCALCHGPTGAGSDTGKALKVKDLTSKEVQNDTDAAMRHIITAGKGNMPPFGDKFSPETLDGLIKIVRSFAKEKPDAAPPKAAQK